MNPEELAATFTPISLESANRQASLQTRLDRKYVLSSSDLESVMAPLRGYRALEIEGVRVFPYDSVYFDTETWTTYRQHMQRRRRRFKCRTRLYASSKLCFLELKLKGGRGQTSKKRMDYDPEDHARITAAGRDFLNAELMKAYGTEYSDALRPSLRVFYRRITMVHPLKQERVTCDFDLSFSGEGFVHRIAPGHVVVETKSANARGEMDRLLRNRGHQAAQSCSKYCLGISMEHPSLPNNAIRPLLRRHFTASNPSARFPAEPMEPGMTGI